MTTQQLDDIELKYPMHEGYVQSLINKAEREALEAAEAQHQAWLKANPLAEKIGGVA